MAGRLRALLPEITAARAAVLFAGWIGVCVVRFLSYRYASFPPAGAFGAAALGRVAELASSLALFWAAAATVGAGVLALLRPKGLSSGERALAALGLGAGGLGLAGLALGLCGEARPILLFEILVALAAIGGAAAARPLARAAADWRERPPRLARGAWEDAAAPLAALAVFGLVSFLLSAGPQIFYDSLVYHLALPELYLRHARIAPTPFNVYAGIPAGTEMLYLWLLPLDPGGSLCQMLHWSFGVLTAAAIVAIARRRGAALDGAWAAAIFCSSPMVLIIARRAGVELATSFYAALTLLALLVPELEEGVVGPTLAGLFVGLALGTKYQAIVLLPAAAAFALYTRGRAALRGVLRLSATAVVVAAPWGLRNLLFYGNPVYPFLDGLFSKGGLVDPAALAASGHVIPLAETFGTLSGFARFATRLWHFSYNSERDNLLSLSFLLLAPLLVAYRPRATARALLLLGAAMWLPLYLTIGVARYAIPALVPLSLAAAFSLSALPNRLRDYARRAVALSFFLGGLAAFDVKDMDEYWRALESPGAAEAYLAQEHASYPNPSFSAYEWANVHLPADAKVLFLGEQRAFGLERDVLSASLYVIPPIALFTKTSSSGDEVYRRLRDAGVTHLFINKEELERIEYALSLTPSQAARFDDFWKKHVEPLRMPPAAKGDERTFAFYRLADAARGGTPVPPYLIATDYFTPDAKK